MKQHGIIWIIAVGLALGLGRMDYETTSWRVLLCHGRNASTLLIFTLVFASIGYGTRSLLRKKT